MSSMRLPAALQAWHPWLSWFTPELAAELGDVIQRMLPLLGRFQGRRQGGSPEPDGVDDLHRRGSYERLLSSEWLLATELPDEFLRRAAGGEHLFLAPRPRAAQADRLIVAVFDTGPWQLGAPRLAHLALWILLARRAAEAGGELRWGALHTPGQWHEATTPEHLKDMLRARRFASAEVDGWQRWSAWLDEHANGVGECWLIGHAADDATRIGANAPTHTVRVRPSLQGDSLHIALRSRHALRSMELPLPSPTPTARLLKGHFQNEAPPDVHRQQAERLSLKHAPVIAPSGTQVAVALLSGDGVMVFRVPAQNNRKGSKPRHQQWTKGADPLCAAFAGKSLGAVLSLPQLMYFWQMPGLATSGRPPREDFDAPAGRASLLPCVWQRNAGQTRLYVLDAARRLVYWVSARNAANGARGPMLLHQDVLALAPVNENRVVYVSQEDGQLWVRFAGPSGREQTAYQLPFGLAVEPVVFLAGGAFWNARFAGCAVRMSPAASPELWRVHEASPQPGRVHDSWEAQLAPDARALGLVHLPRLQGHALVVQAANRCDFFLQSKQGAEFMYSTPTVAERFSVCPRSGIVALLTRERELHVYSPADQSVRLIIHSDGGTSSPAHDATN